LYSRIFADVDGVRIFQRDGDRADNCWLSAILVDPATAGWAAEDLRLALAEHDIESRPLWKPMHQQPLFAGARSFLTGAADDLFATGLALPSGTALTSAQRERVASVIEDFLAARR
jgi:dTDP-4-amino-4,6-dideoxygalactose transaminase